MTIKEIKEKYLHANINTTLIKNIELDVKVKAIFNMSDVVVNDGTASIEISVSSPEAFNELKKNMNSNGLVKIKGNLEKDDYDMLLITVKEVISI